MLTRCLHGAVTISNEFDQTPHSWPRFYTDTNETKYTDVYMYK